MNAVAAVCWAVCCILLGGYWTLLWSRRTNGRRFVVAALLLLGMTCVALGQIALLTLGLPGRTALITLGYIPEVLAIPFATIRHVAR